MILGAYLTQPPTLESCLLSCGGALADTIASLRAEAAFGFGLLRGSSTSKRVRQHLVFPSFLDVFCFGLLASALGFCLIDAACESDVR